MGKSGSLILIPTPIAPKLPLEPLALELLSIVSLFCQTLDYQQKPIDILQDIQRLLTEVIPKEHLRWLPETQIFSLLKNSSKSGIIVFEDPKPARQMWLKNGLPREMIDHFQYLNEHQWEKESHGLLKSIQQGHNVFLMSDGGVPAFCDPGAFLVGQCHERSMTVRMTPFPNSVLQAIALSGYLESQFHFYGFLPKGEEERQALYSKIREERKFLKVVMDTPYRLEKVLTELKEHQFKDVFLALDLNCLSEEHYRGSPGKILSQLSLFKREFILVIKD